MKIRLLLAAAILFVTFAVPGHTQEVTAGVYGSVVDNSNAVIPNATIRLRNVATGRSWQTASDGAGNFSVTLLPIGTYEVSAEASGFKKSVLQDVTLRVNENRRVVFTMDVGQLTESITVEATAVAVNTATGTTSQLLDGGEMVKLPSRGRYVFPYALLMPGVVSDTPYDRRNNR
ncbi:MAG: carboxypeptidase regulatory-like domain-containing protein, partial [Acidobacteria bacterium]|nr:carboxypeptidase regulatory-like domain-containing protein [Acidobacteriota bacterium]